MIGQPVKFLTLIVVAILMLVGCAGDPVVPVSDLTALKNRYAARVVRPGDTLYLIAWESGLDYRQLAAWNLLIPPYRLKPGNRIRLTPPKKQQDADTESLVGENNVSKSPRVVQWIWPASGNIIQSFTGRNGNNGLDISGDAGSAVRAAAPGIVVYAGSGVRGYGQLLIIQHNEDFLSAYAHNRALLVEEGVTVEIGQIVAEMGNTDAETTRLHFEIRRDGKPVNPLKYLPRRSS